MTERHKRIHDLTLVKHRVSESILQEKDKFCSFVFTHHSPSTNNRDQLFHLLSQYKRVDSGGAYLNNIGYCFEDRLVSCMPYKFDISFLNSRNYTYQDRPSIAFATKSIPIYWGNRNIEDYFNENAFINCHKYESLEEVVERVKEIDGNDKLFLDMLQTPAFIHPETTEEIQERFDQWVIHIVEHGSVQRGGGVFHAMEENIYRYGYKKYCTKMRITSLICSALAAIFRPFKHTKLGQSVKRLLLYGKAKTDYNK